MAIANQPRLLIADEPMNALEPITKAQIFRLLSSMNKNQGTSILLTSNEINSISDWCVLYLFYTVDKTQNQALKKVF